MPGGVWWRLPQPLFGRSSIKIIKKPFSQSEVSKHNENKINLSYNRNYIYALWYLADVRDFYIWRNTTTFGRRYYDADIHSVYTLKYKRLAIFYFTSDKF